jgi:hypothetical protein
MKVNVLVNLFWCCEDATAVICIVVETVVLAMSVGERHSLTAKSNVF